MQGENTPDLVALCHTAMTSAILRALLSELQNLTLQVIEDGGTTGP